MKRVMDKVEMADELAVARLSLEAVLTAWPQNGLSGSVELRNAVDLVGDVIELLDPERTT